jgi:hypothetical protein
LIAVAICATVPIIAHTPHFLLVNEISILPPTTTRNDTIVPHYHWRHRHALQRKQQIFANIYIRIPQRETAQYR